MPAHHRASATPVPTVATVWVGANWPEREAYDMYGIRFEGHPDMTRILLWEGFNGFPLRKEFPVEGIDTGAAINILDTWINKTNSF